MKVAAAAAEAEVVAAEAEEAAAAKRQQAQQLVMAGSKILKMADNDGDSSDYGLAVEQFTVRPSLD
jgi:hypothetical protein